MMFRRLARKSRDGQEPPALFALCLLPFFALMFFYNVIGELCWFRSEVNPVLLAAAFGPLALLYVKRRQVFLMPEQSTEAVRKFDKIKDEFVTVASHELRTPLAIINGFAEILVREKLGTLNEEQKRRVRKILMQAQRLNRIVDNLLDLSRIRSGKIEIRREVFDLTPVLKSCLDDHQVVCSQQKIELVDQLADVMPDVVGDVERTMQIAVNLVNNAVKYTHPGGKVTVRTVYDKSKDRVRVEVEDTGIGIGLDNQPMIFKEFFRATDEHSRKYAGSGLGLAIVKQLVEGQGGEVGFHSEGLGRGATFFFTLPTSAPARAEAKPKSVSIAN